MSTIKIVVVVVTRKAFSLNLIYNLNCGNQNQCHIYLVRTVQGYSEQTKLKHMARMSRANHYGNARA